MGVKREALNDGKILRILVERFNRERTRQNLIGLLACLRDSYVWIPCNVNMCDADYEKFLHAKKGDTVSTDSEVRLTPDILKNGDDLFFPVFSNCAQMGTDYGAHFSKIEKHFFEAMSMASAHEEVAGIVLDAFTQPFVLEKDLFDFVGNLPSSIEDK